MQRFAYGGSINNGLLEIMGRLNGAVLDVGCGVGLWAPELRRQGATQLTGIDSSLLAAALARDRYDHIVAAPIESLELDDLGGKPFEHVVAADVLEHLVDPWAALRLFHDWTRVGAQLAVSVPNLRYYKVSLALVMGGRFEYEPSGVMDWTHLRWFTKRSLSHSLAHSGWRPIRWGWALGGKRELVSHISGGCLDGLCASQIRVVSVRE
jgi:2-polyprenyl-3-methyl-5-hydroxy-6-metoxy-1,4-benzoquinol methylase